MWLTRLRASVSVTDARPSLPHPYGMGPVRTAIGAASRARREHMKRSHNRVSTDHVPPQFLPLRIVVLCLLAAMLAAACGGAGSGNRPSASADTHKALLGFAQCLPEHGITRFPDPRSAGGFSLVGPTNSVDL